MDLNGNGRGEQRLLDVKEDMSPWLKFQKLQNSHLLVEPLNSDIVY